ncbi:MAG: TatD family hydrolase [Bacillota bacterium]
MQLIDTHAHLDFPRFDKDREEVIKRARKNDIVKIVNVGANLASSRRSLELSQHYEYIFATAGVHPHDADQVDKNSIQVLKDFSKPDKVVAIGEIGLDFHYNNSPQEVQIKAFKKQLQLAREINLPVVIHSREAERETMKILKEAEINRGILHCFAGDMKMAEEALDMGLYLAFGGIITFNSADKLRKIVKNIPLERILLETDAPYLTPVPRRGKRNEPSYVRYVAKKIADIKKVEVEKIAEITSSNAEHVYGI